MTNGRDLRLLVGGLALSSLGDLLAIAALTIRVHDLTGSGWAVSALLLSGLVPLVLFGPVAGALVDRFESRRVIVVTTLLQTAVAVAVAFADALPTILVLSFILGMGLALTQPAFFALVPRAAGDERVTEANAYLELARYGGATLGPVLAGGLASGVGVRGAMLLDGVTFLLAAGATALMRVRREGVAESEKSSSRRVLVRQGAEFIFGDRLLRLVLGVVALAVLFAGTSNVAAVFFAKRVLDAGNAGFGLMEGAWALGMAVCALVIARGRKPAALGFAALTSAIVMGSALLITGAAALLAVTIVMYFVGGSANALGNISMRSLIHQRAPENVRGRVYSAYAALGTAAQIAAMGLGGVLVSALGSRVTLLLAGGSALLVGTFGIALYAGWGTRVAAGPERRVA